MTIQKVEFVIQCLKEANKEVDIEAITEVCDTLYPEITLEQRKQALKAEYEKSTLEIIKGLGKANELDICKFSLYTYKEIHHALKSLKHKGVIDYNDDGDYFIVEKGQ